ncbi:MAG TPA: ATP-grasp fold amidoligase family protein [Casimicrobiaceae bacterium]|nr:ATP-grasp fold amidoligase family protein [Casimicrobiaceae bacterium]
MTSWSTRLREHKLELRRRLAARFVDDRTYVSSLYRQAFGRAPNLDRPSGFNEKILAKILTDRRAFLSLFSDKLRVRSYVAHVAPALTLPALYWRDARAESLDLDALPDAFMLKPNHGSGWLRAVPDKHTATRDELVRLMRRWLASDFSIVGREWAYRNIEREVFAEELLRGPDGGTPADYKLFVFGGVVRLIQVDTGRFTRHTQALYDERWQPIAGTIKGAQGAAVPPPSSLSTMIDAAQALSLGVDFVRVDLYEIGGRPYFGELTHYPNKGLNRFDPPSLDARLGGYLMLDEYATDAISARVLDLAGAASPEPR